MKFIASIILIVLISQHSITGFPTNNTISEKQCSEGSELINDECVPIDSTTGSGEIDSTTGSNEIDSTTDSGEIDSTTDSSEIETTSEKINLHEEELVTEVHEPEKTHVCPDGMKSGEHDICEEIQIQNTTEVNIELTTDPQENVGGMENMKGCPPGTEADEQGSCQEIKPTNSTKKITNPKALLNEDGSCPDNYKMIEGRCLYIKSKTNSTLISSSNTNNLEPKSKLESVPVLSDNSCPEGTEYSEYGLCQKRYHAPTLNLQTKSDGSCSNGYELINGKCTPKNSQAHIQLELTTKVPHMIKDTTVIQDVTSNEEFSSTRESKVTSTPL